MIIPIGHEDLRGQRWPIWTIAIIIGNFILFGVTYTSFDREQAAIAKLKLDIYRYVVEHPYLEKDATANKVFTDVQRSYRDPRAERLLQHFAEIGETSRRAKRAEQEELNQMSAKLEGLIHDSTLYQYGLVPAEKNTLGYLTSMFLHGGWLHIIFNMLFLWLCGCNMEDSWGRLIFPAFYLMSGIAASMTHAFFYPDSTMPCIGASGAIAGAMGAFMIRFYKTKIRFLYIWLFRAGTFEARAYVVLPIWLGEQLLSALLAGNAPSGVAFWAHIGGFIFGACFAVVMKISGLERHVAKSIEQKVTLTGDARLSEAMALLEEQKPEEALGILRQLLTEEPRNLDAHMVLLNCFRQMGRHEEEARELRTIVHLYLSEKNYDAALEMFDAIADRDKPSVLDVRDWFEICKYLDEKVDPLRAAQEYQKLFTLYPHETLGMKSVLRAADLYLTKLANKVAGLELYRKALTSLEPGSPWKDVIENALKQTGMQK